MTDKTFAVAGVSKLNGRFRARFAKDMMRVKVLDKAGHEDVQLTELPEPMTKAAAASYLIDQNFDRGNAEIRDALYAEIDRAAGVKKPKTVEQLGKDEGEEESATAGSGEEASDDSQGVSEDVLEAAREIAAEMTVPEGRQLSMSPSAIRKREARAAARAQKAEAEAVS